MVGGLPLLVHIVSITTLVVSSIPTHGKVY